MAKKQVLLTREGVLDLEGKLEYLKTVRRSEVAEQIKQARAFGDISENAEYDEAKNEQARIEGEIASIEGMLRNAVIIDDENIDLRAVNVGARVKVYDEEFEEEAEYTLVGSTEADPSKNRISNESPVGIALLGKSVGAKVEVSTPDGAYTLKILEISK
ncbi:MAG: transcription elongation factor GreA [Christensenellales bacterium]|jgi:transcription elongation factor GreA